MTDKNCIREKIETTDQNLHDKEHEGIDAVYTWVNGSDPLLIRSLMQLRRRIRRKEGNFSFDRVLDSWSSRSRCHSQVTKTGNMKGSSTFLELLPVFVLPEELEKKPLSSSQGNSSSIPIPSWIPISQENTSLLFSRLLSGTKEGIPSSGSEEEPGSVIGKLSGYTSSGREGRKQDWNSKKNDKKRGKKKMMKPDVGDKTRLPSSLDSLARFFYFPSGGIDRRKHPFSCTYPFPSLFFHSETLCILSHTRRKSSLHVTRI